MHHFVDRLKKLRKMFKCAKVAIAVANFIQKGGILVLEMLELLPSKLPQFHERKQIMPKTRTTEGTPMIFRT